MSGCLSTVCRSILENIAQRQLSIPDIPRRLFSSALGGHDTFYYKDLQVETISHPSPKTPKEELGFGKVFTDHMFIVQHTDSAGWGLPKIVPFQNLSIHPAAQVFHYGLGAFEGMKAYELFKCMQALLQLDRSWLPEGDGYSMYIRPFAFASATTLGVTKPAATTVAIILSPVGPYFSKGGGRGVSLFLDEVHVRAWPGGAGDCKIGGNYAPTFLPQAAAMAEHGTPQVMYTMPHGPDPLDAAISECGAMNMFFLLDSPERKQPELVTPPLDGTILPGVTRDSILQLARSWPDISVNERAITVRELLDASREGRLLEAFGAGTASVVQPVASIVRRGGEVLQLPDSSTAPESVSMRLLATIRDIQHARIVHPWSVPFE